MNGHEFDHPSQAVSASFKSPISPDGYAIEEWNEEERQRVSQRQAFPGLIPFERYEIIAALEHEGFEGRTRGRKAKDGIPTQVFRYPSVHAPGSLRVATDTATGPYRKLETLVKPTGYDPEGRTGMVRSYSASGANAGPLRPGALTFHILCDFHFHANHEPAMTDETKEKPDPDAFNLYMTPHEAQLRVYRLMKEGRMPTRSNSM